MFESETVFVVGAGASKEAGLPIGSELTTKIAALLDFKMNYREIKKGDPEIHSALLRLVSDTSAFKNNQFLGSGREVAEAMELALSIDTFLESHASNSEFVALGKLGIVRAVAGGSS